MSQSSITECNAANDAANSLLDGGTIEIRTGSVPDIDLGPSGAVLETFTIPATAFQASVSRVAVMNTIAPISTATSGSPPYHYEAFDSLGNLRRSGTVGVSNSDMIISKPVWVAGDTLQITAWSTEQPK